MLRDDHGDVLAVTARKYSNTADALMPQALAARDGVLLADRGMHWHKRSYVQ
jgi:hypothetical protein